MARRAGCRQKQTMVRGVKTAFFLACGLLTCTLMPLAAEGEAAPASPPAQMVFAGSGSNLPLVRVLAEAFSKRHPEIRIEVPASIGSSGGIQAAADGAIALGLISRPLKEKEEGLGLTVLNYAQTPMVIAVHPTVAEENITHAELLDIYRGKKKAWKDGREIVVLTREPGDSSVEVLVEGVPGFKGVYEESQQARRWTTLLKDLAMNETLARTPSAIGLSDLGAVTIEQHAIKPLKVNGAAPSVDNLQSGKYPLHKTLAFAYREERLSAGARLFIDFVRSTEGEKVLRANGYLPEQ